MPDAPTTSTPVAPVVPAAPPATPAATAPAPAPATGDEPLGEGGLRALQAERDARKALETQLAEAKQKITEREQLDMSELDRAKATAEQLAAELATATAQRLRLEVAAEHNIPAAYHHLLTATEPEALKAQAATLAQLATAAATPAFVPNPGQGTPQGPPPSLSEQISAAEQSGDLRAASALKAQQLLAMRPA